MVAEIFQRFVQESPLAVMVRATLENAFAAPSLDALFAQTAEQQYTRPLLFSTVVEVMTAVVLRQEQSLHAAFQQRREQVAVGISSLYEKLARMETGVSEALVRHSVVRIAPVLQELAPTPRRCWLAMRCAFSMVIIWRAPSIGSSPCGGRGPA